VRATIDVDVIVEVTTLARHHRFSNQLRQLGFIEDTSGGAPICRWNPMMLSWMLCQQILRFLVLEICGSRLHTKLLNGLSFQIEEEKNNA